MSQATFDFTITRADEAKFGHHHSGAGKQELAAAKKQVQVGGKKRLEVLGLIVDSGDTGLTRHELFELHGIYLPTVCGRVRELLDGGFLYEAGERQNRSILRATDRGKRAASSPRSESNPAPRGVNANKSNPRQGLSSSSLTSEAP